MSLPNELPNELPNGDWVGLTLDELENLLTLDESKNVIYSDGAYCSFFENDDDDDDEVGNEIKIPTHELLQEDFNSEVEGGYVYPEDEMSDFELAEIYGDYSDNKRDQLLDY